MKRNNNFTNERILDAAELLFSERGYGSVTLQEIAQAVEMRHASLYYYAPGGKEQLYVAVMERSFRRHGEGLTNAIIDAGGDVRDQLHAVARWFATHPPLDLGRIVRSDLPAINPTDAARLIDLSLEMLRVPISAVIRSGVKRGLLDVRDPDFAAMGLVALLQSVHNIPRQFLPTNNDLALAAQSAADMVLYGWFRR